MALVVKKFGGTSVGSLERIRNVAALIQRYRNEHPGDQVAVVVSAMAGETNRLVALAKECVSDPDSRELDVMLATGEQVSIALLSMALIDLGIPARSFTSFQAEILTDDSFNNAKIEGIDADKLKQTISTNVVPVVAGFQGVDQEGNITTLGRGGSDITAVALAVALKADACFIYTDVEGVYTTDPRICSKAQHLSKVSHEEMLEMASLGAKVLHPRSVYFAMRYHMPLVVLSTFNPTTGTWIVREEEIVEKPVVTGVTYRTDETKLTIDGLEGGSKAINEVFAELANQDIFVDMITQTGLVDGKTSISFTVPTDSGKRALSIIKKLSGKFGGQVALDDEIAKISVIGQGMKYHSGVAAKMFGVLAEEEIDVQMISTSEIKISVVLPKKYCELAVRAIHGAFIEQSPQISAET